MTFVSLQYPGDQHTRDTSWLQTVTAHRLSVNGEHLLSCDDPDHSVCDRNKKTTVATASTQETQTFTCNSGADFYLSFMGLTTKAITPGIPLQGDGGDGTSFEELLQDIEPVNAGKKAFEAGVLQPHRHQFQVTVSSDATVTGIVNGANVTMLECGGETVSVTFDTLNGDLPLMYVDSAYATETVKGVPQPVVGRLPYSMVIRGLRDAAVSVFGGFRPHRGANEHI